MTKELDRHGPRYLTAVSIYDTEPPDLAAVLDLLEPPAWQADAACREHPEIDWFPTACNNIAEAKKVCAGCLVNDECANWAVSCGTDLQGIWGGRSQRERLRLQRLTAQASTPLDAA